MVSNSTKIMTSPLDTLFLRWLAELSEKKQIPIDQLTQLLATNEIENRVDLYPELKIILSEPRLDAKKVKKIITGCWAAGSQYQKIRFMRVLENESKATKAFEDFIHDFPEYDRSATIRINNFIEQMIGLGYTDLEGRKDSPGAALISSVFLTALYPSRFVDFLPTRWKKFSEQFEYAPEFPQESSYGEKIVWAGKFATELSNTSTFKKYWPQYNPLWIVASLCWKWQDPYVADFESTDIDPSFSVEEGKKRLRSHISRERSRFLMAIVKAQRKREDPLLKCDVCKFSFVEKYGDVGQEFIEGHHKTPLASLEEGQRTKPEDIALVCSNCHRMIHRNGESRSIEEMRKLLQ